MVVDIKARMSAALFNIQLIALTIFTAVVSGQDDLLQECGTLNMNYYYNQNRMTQIDEYPWMGRILYENTANNTFWFKCYTVLISNRFVVLKASCFDYEEEPYRVYLGDWDIGNDKTRSDCDDGGRCAPVPNEYEIEEIIIHRNYSSKFKYNDIALIKLGKTVTYSDFIRPICLPSMDVVQKNFVNQQLELTGWYTDQNVSSILAKTSVRVVSLNSCEAKMKYFTLDKKTNICAYTCSDKFVFAIGSALMDIKTVNGEPAYYYLIGLNIHGVGVCSLSYPDVYIRVDRYLDWIYTNIAE